MIKGDPPYFGGFLNPPGHARAGEKMGPRLVTLQANWFEGDGKWLTDCGGSYCWTRFYPERK
ncbi:hypothetical protein DQQ10_18810 [Pseudochryseolinea flava]|uniref:Uncharacterized protein n=1 Tax=Pseudochryseolinea flava TaxID=2059302 RepID=A0A364XYR7_9BACT|nr:hypothetical protein DQQ10_18810 [Pseudochryseolinea flava]